MRHISINKGGDGAGEDSSGKGGENKKHTILK
jgi:hypothetical protein